MSIATGTRVGVYEVVTQIGAGGMGDAKSRFLTAVRQRPATGFGMTAYG